MGLFDAIGGVFKDLAGGMTTKANKSDPNAFNTKLDPRIQELLKKRALGLETPQDRAFLDAQMGRATSAVASQAAGARGTNAGLAQRNAVVQGSQTAQNVTGQAGLQRLQNQGASLEQAINTEEANRQALMKKQQIDSQIEMSNAEGQNAAVGGLLSGAASGASAAILASDEKLKKDIEPAGNQIQKFLDHLSAFKFEYKEPEKFGEGEQIGVMAQDLEKGPGKMAVKETEDGKMVDYNQLLPMLLASQAELNKRLKKLEE